GPIALGIGILSHAPCPIPHARSHPTPRAGWDELKFNFAHLLNKHLWVLSIACNTLKACALS
ncbi:hypothetical protein, partial [Tolypothrix sp. VBCCA 56010]|uniref:hypothetical protein n=1 Tax=Tolypothrix sp. VBCCA 56010 TaxID=3137731 RepID=UPI003D7E04CA